MTLRPPPPHPHLALLAGVVGVVTVADQASKAWIRDHLQVREARPVLPGLLELFHLENPGITWGLLSGHPLRLPFVTFLSLAAVLLVGAWFRRLGPVERPLALSLALVLGGAAGNFLDRLLYRRVTDFLHVIVPGAPGDWLEALSGSRSWAVFNLADVAISGGLLLFALLVAQGRAAPPRLGVEPPTESS